jgi:hypothetical protein
MFQEQVVDPDMAGDCKLFGDLDGDGFLDLISGGGKEEGLIWYGNPDWQKRVVAFPKVEFTTDGDTGDVDGDGDIDIVIGDGEGKDNLILFYNPAELEGAGGNPKWTYSVIGTVGSWVKDIELADFNGDGSLDVAARSRQALKIFFSNGSTGWRDISIEVAHLGMKAWWRRIWIGMGASISYYKERG